MTTDGGPAFPCKRHDQVTQAGTETKFWQDVLYPGMSLRDWFAGQALTAMTAAPDYVTGPADGPMADRAYRIADCMLAARERKDSE